jgi:hypothetical protein
VKWRKKLRLQGRRRRKLVAEDRLKKDRRKATIEEGEESVQGD